MGQYYKPILLDESGKPEAWAYSHDYNNGLKLMEHSYIGNNFVQRVEAELVEKPRRLVWAGDYAKHEPDMDDNLYGMLDDSNKLHPGGITIECRYLINHDKKQYVNLDKVEDDGDPQYPLRIHPLPLLTCEGNGQGGGDFRGDSPLVGSWARDHIQLTNTLDGLVGFTELVPAFSE